MADEERYSNRQFEMLLEKQSDHLIERMDLLLAPILEQVKKTNGRVGVLEKNVSKLKTFRSIIYTFSGVVVLVLIPLVAAYITAHTGHS